MFWRDRSIAVRIMILGLALPVYFGPAEAGETEAHKIAQQFSRQAWESEKAAVDRQRAAEEAEMLAKARAEAEAEARKQQKLEAWRAKQGLPPPSKANTEAEAAKAEVAEREKKRLQAEREREAKQLALKLERARLAREQEAQRLAAEKAPKAEPVKPAPQVAAPAHPYTNRPVPPMALGQKASPPPATGDRVTVLLIMEPGKRGIRRLRKSADPVLCFGKTCFISKGPATAAREVSRMFALGPGNTFGFRAGACRNQLKCVFRGVNPVSAPEAMQPVDLKVLVHDRRQPSEISRGSGCSLTGARLTCARTIETPTYRAWIVPEALAQSAGSGALEAALASGLAAPYERQAGLLD